MTWTWNWSLPVDLDLWILLFYVASLMIGAKVVEVVAQLHFARAQRYGEHGFEYIEPRDAYRCPEGKFLELHRVHDDKRVAVYRAQAGHCRVCRLNTHCRPSPDGRLVYRSLAAWAETTVGVFHRCVSVVMFAAAVGLCMVALWRRSGDPGSTWVAGGLMVGVLLMIQRVQMILRAVRSN
jgi:hypothetical protein